ncbi:MAG: hypothetical protein GY909_18025 [Oligoflexia bacterium]|nr:hypothetical protein [Oligoflexia bacterium]
MKLKHFPLLILILLTVGLLKYSDSLIQYNKEEVFLSSEAFKSYKVFSNEFESQKVVLGYLETEQPSQIEANFSKIKEKYPEVQFAWAKDFVQKDTDNEIRDFYSINNKLSIKLVDSKGHYFIFSHDEMDPQELDRFFKNVLVSMPNVKLIGPSFTNYHLNIQSLKIKEVAFPLLFVFSLCIIFLCVRSLLPTLYIFFISLFSVGITLSLTKIFFETSNMVTAISPLVTFVITLAMSFHFYFSSLAYRSVDEILSWKLKPFVLMTITTVIGFASLRFSEITAVKQFALLSSVSILISSLFVIFFWIKFYSNIPKGRLVRFKYTNLLVMKAKKNWSYLFCFISILLGVICFSKIPVLVEAAYFLPEEHIVRTSLDKLHNDFLGNPNLEIIIKKKNDKYETLLEINDIENEIKILHPSINNLTSMNTIVKDVNYIYSQNRVLPDFEIAYQTLLSKSPEILKAYKNYDEKYHITIYGKLLHTEDYFNFISNVENFLKDKNIEYELNGIYYQLMVSQRNLIKTLIVSFMFSLIIVCLIVAFFFKSLKDFLIFILVNIGPPALGILFLYLSGFSMNVATIMTFSVSFGLIVDSTIHIIFAIKNNENIHEYKISTILPIFYVSILLIFSFLVIGFSDFLPIRQFGVLMAVTLLAGLIYDLYIVPSLKKL